MTSPHPWEHLGGIPRLACFRLTSDWHPGVTRDSRGLGVELPRRKLPALDGET